MRKVISAWVISVIILPAVYFNDVLNSENHINSFRRVHTQNNLIEDEVLLNEAKLRNILIFGEGGSIVIDEEGNHVARMSTDANNTVGVDILVAGSLTYAEIIQGINEGRYSVKSQQKIIDEALEDRSKCVLVYTGGGDAAGINALYAAATERLAELNSGMTVLGIRHAGDGLTARPENLRKNVVIIDNLIAEYIKDMGSTNIGSSRENPFKDEHWDNTMQNIAGFGAFICTGGDDNLKTAQKIAEANPETVVLATAKTIDGDVTINGIGVQSLGFHSAVGRANSNIVDSAYSFSGMGSIQHPIVEIIEVFGRNTGRLAFEAARFDNFDGLNPAEIKQKRVTNNATVIVVPEHNVTIEEIADKIREMILRTDGTAIVIVAEGYRPGDDPDILKNNVDVDDMGNELKTGIGRILVARLVGFLPDATITLEDLGGDIIIKSPKLRGGVENYELRGVNPDGYDMAMASNIGIKMAEFIMQGMTGGRFVGYTNGMDPMHDAPIVLELTGISNGNTLELYDLEVLIRNGILVSQPE